jgi:hypothetical protein
LELRPPDPQWAAANNLEETGFQRALQHYLLFAEDEYGSIVHPVGADGPEDSLLVLGVILLLLAALLLIYGRKNESAKDGRIQSWRRFKGCGIRRKSGLFGVKRHLFGPKKGKISGFRLMISNLVIITNG